MSPSDFTWYHSKGDGMLIDQHIKPKEKVTSLKAATPALASARPKRTLHPLNKVIDPANAVKASLTLQQQAIEARHVAEVEAATALRSMLGLESQSPALTPALSVASLPPTRVATSEASLPGSPATKHTVLPTDVDSDSENEDELAKCRSNSYLFGVPLVTNSETGCKKAQQRVYESDEEMLDIPQDVLTQGESL